MKICSVCKRCFGEDETACVDPGHGKLVDGPHSVDIVPGYALHRIVENSPATKIFQARQIEYGQDCFITIAEGDTQKFLADAQTAARLFHAGIGGVIESGHLGNGAVYAVSEGIAGTSVREILASGVPSLLDAIRIARQAAEAVHELHLAGLKYGAMKPENVSVNGLGTDTITVKIHNLDLGSAFATSVLSNRFAMEASLDSIRYFAPEQFRGEDLGVSSDVYSLGLLLYEIFAGHAPFEAASASELIDMHLNQRAPDVTIDNFDIRMLLTHTITESLQKQPSFRQSTADLFARQLRHVEQLSTHVSTPPPAVTVPVRVDSPSPAPSMAPAAPQFVERPARHIEQPEVVPTPVIPVAPAIPLQPGQPTHAAMYAQQPDVTLTPVINVREEAPAETELPPVAEPVPTVIPYVPQTGKRSRLKGMKKRLHAQVSRTNVESEPAPAEPVAEPKLLEWSQPEQDIPSVAAMMAEIERTDRPSAVDARNVYVDDSDDEITAVRPPSQRVVVEWESDRAALSAAEPKHEVGLFGTLPVSRSEETGNLVTSITAYVAGIRRSSRGPAYAAVAIFCLVAGGLGLFSLGDSSADTTGYLGSNENVGIQTLPVRMREPVVKNETPAAELPTEETALAEQIPTLPVAPHPERAVTAAEVVSKKEPEVAADVAKPVVNKKEAPAREGDRVTSERSAPLKPSTMVISASAGKPKVIVVSDAPPFGSTKLANEIRNRAGSTRPRIVLVPR